MNFEYINKYPEVDQFRYRRSFLLLGLVISLFLVFILVNISSFSGIKYENTGITDLKDFEMIPPQTAEQPEKPKLPPPVKVELIAISNSSDENMNTDFLRSDIGVDENINLYSVDSASNKNVTITSPEVNDPGESMPVFIAEMMPRFPGCETLESNQEREICAQQKLMEYIYSNLRYPAIAAETGVEGRVTLRFVVTESGRVENVEILRDIGAGCGEEAKKVIEKMNTLSESWIPGRQAGRKVKVYFTLPVVFQLKG
ncbi:MAG: energy transducer TonB [Deltaproteobacteria bacterium]